MDTDLSCGNALFRVVNNHEHCINCSLVIVRVGLYNVPFID